MALRVRKIPPTYQLRVALQDIAPSIWRRIQVRGDITLYRLHGVLQVAMGWENCHLYDFVIGRTRYGPREGDFGPDAQEDGRTRLHAVATVEGFSFTYNYDFGDGWEHEIVVEKILPVEKEARFPLCLSGERACPPEDCGGPPGYADFLKSIKTPKGARRGAAREASAMPFDPEALDLLEINRRLRELR